MGGLGIHGDPWGSRSRIPRGSSLRPFEAQPRDAPGPGPWARASDFRTPCPGPWAHLGPGPRDASGPGARGPGHEASRGPVPGCPGASRGPAGPGMSRGPRPGAQGLGPGHGVRTCPDPSLLPDIRGNTFKKWDRGGSNWIESCRMDHLGSKAPGGVGMDRKLAGQNLQ